jgi:leucyl-tRNA synthetase
MDAAEEKEMTRIINKTIMKVTDDIEKFRFNTMLAALMEFTNYLGKVQEAGTVSVKLWDEAINALLLLVAPSTPHLAEELWTGMGKPYSVHNQTWPKYDPALVKEDQITLVVQVNGKVRDKIDAPASITEEEAREMALSSDKIKGHLEGKTPVKVIYVPSKLINIVVK